MSQKIEAFDATLETFQNYAERLEMFFLANDVTDNKKAAMLLSCIGAITYKLVRSLTHPELPSSKTYGELKEILISHLSPKPLEISERFRFHKRNQKDGESIQNYVVEIKKLSENCNFGNELDKTLSDRLVCGLKDSQIQKRLLQEEHLTFQKAFDKAVALEMASRDATDMHSNFPVHAVHKSTHSSKSTFNKSTNNNKFQPCFSCGKRNHKRQDCFFRDSVCSSCKKKGHIKAVCKSRSTSTNANYNNYSKSKSSFHKVDNVERKFEDFFCMQHLNNNKIWVHMKMDGKQTKMELDTGASLSLMTASDYYSIFKKMPILKPTNKMLRTYTGELIEPLGTRSEYSQHSQNSATAYFRKR